MANPSSTMHINETVRPVCRPQTPLAALVAPGYPLTPTGTVQKAVYEARDSLWQGPNP